MVYGFDMISGPSMGISSSVRLVLSISVAVWDVMWMHFLSSGSCSLFLAPCGMSASGIDLNNGLVSGSNCKLVFGVTTLLCHTVACSNFLDFLALPCWCQHSYRGILSLLQKLLLVFKIGTLKL